MEKLDFRKFYKTKIVPSFREDEVAPDSRRNSQSHRVPKLVKICINRGIGEAAKNSSELDLTKEDLSLITGQKPLANRAKKSIAGFKIRDNMTVGSSVTLRGKRMYSFLEKLIYIALPRVRNFRGNDLSSFDGKGNYNLGISDQFVFPEISDERMDQKLGLNISIVTNTTSDKESLALLNAFGMVFEKHHQSL